MNKTKKRSFTALLCVLVCALALVLSLGILSACGSDESATVDESASGTWYYGDKEPAEDLGRAGDFYLNTETLASYVKEGKTWRIAAEGETGSWYYGTAAPLDTIGEANDFYLNTKTGELYQKSAGGWGSSILTLKGEKGRDGVVWFSGNKAPTEYEEGDPTLKDAQPGDFYLNTDGFDVYQLKADGTWDHLGSIKGEEAPRGTLWFMGTTEPKEAGFPDVREGDFYFRTFGDFSEYKGYQIYHYEGETWRLLADESEPLTPEDIAGKQEYHIPDLESLLSFRAMVNGGENFKDKTVYLDGDIYLSSIESWEPIGTSEHPFCGAFDGQSNTVYDLKVTQNADGTKDRLGFFGNVTDGGAVRELTIVNATVIGESDIGALAGYAFTASEFKNVTVSGKIDLEGNYKVGGVSGGGYGKYTNCTVRGEGDGNKIVAVYKQPDAEGDNVGGIVGFTGEHNQKDGQTETYISGCEVSGIRVEGTRKVGGIVGFLHYNTGIENCTVSNVTVKCNADEGYIVSDGHRLSVGSIIGETNYGAVIKNNRAANVGIDALFTYKFEKTTAHDAPTDVDFQTASGTYLDPEIVGNFRDGHVRATANQIKDLIYADNTFENVTTTARVRNLQWQWWDGNDRAIGIHSIEIETAEELLNFGKKEYKLIMKSGGANNQPGTGSGYGNACLYHPANEHPLIVDLTGELYDLSGEIWEPMNGYQIHINGNLGDGRNAVIRGLNTGEKTGQSGFFFTAGNTVVENVTFQDATVKGSQAGVIIGNSNSPVTLTNVKLAGNIEVTYTGEASDQYPGPGVFVGAWGEYKPATTPIAGCEILAGANVTVQLGNATIPSSKGGTATKNYLFGVNYAKTLFPEDLSPMVTIASDVTLRVLKGETVMPTLG